MKIIFLDIDGVLNGCNIWNEIGWKLCLLTHLLPIKRWYKRTSEPYGVHETKVKRLAKIVHETDAKVVMSSSWRNTFWKTPYPNKRDDVRKLTDLLNKYNIEVIDITPTLPYGNKRQDEIIKWLADNSKEKEVESFIILDDEDSHLRCFVGSNLVHTLSESKISKLLGFLFNVSGINEGLTRKHVKQAIRKLNTTWKRSDIINGKYIKS